MTLIGLMLFAALVKTFWVTLFVTVIISIYVVAIIFGMIDE